MNKFILGEKDEDHLISALWNIACAVTTRERIRKKLLPKELMDVSPPA